MTTTHQPAKLMTIEEVAERLGVSVCLVHERRIPFIKWGHLIRFDPVEVQAWLDECRYEPLRHAI